MAKIRQFIPLIVAILFLCLSITAISHELRHYHPSDIVKSLADIPKSRKLGAIALTVLGYLSMTCYDWLGFLYVRHPLPLQNIVKTSFISYAVGNTIGLTLFSGTAIRYRFYSRAQVPSVDIAKVIAFTHLSFWLGMLAVGGVVFLIDPLTLPDLLHLPFDSVHPLGLIFIAVVALYFTIIGLNRKSIRILGHEFSMPSLALSIGLMLASALDWAIASGVLHTLLPSEAGISYAGFFGIYVLALTAGVISNVPGGLGVFETVILWFRPSAVSASQMIGALLAYRGVYYFLPLFVALLLLGFDELRQRYK